jgi:hypothetical protein
MAGAEDEALPKATRDLLEVMGDEHNRGRARLVGELSEIADERLAGAQVETRTRLVEDQQVRIRHEGPRDLHPPPFAGRQQAEWPIG